MKVAKILLITFVFVFVGICLFFFLYSNPADQEITVTNPPNSIDYSKGEGTNDTEPNPEDPPIIIPGEGDGEGEGGGDGDEGNGDEGGDGDEGGEGDGGTGGEGTGGGGSGDYVTFANFDYNYYNYNMDHLYTSYMRDDAYYADMVLVNFNTSARFNEAGIEEVKIYCDYIHDYFYTASRGNFDIKFNLFLYTANESHLPWLLNDYPYQKESDFYNKALENATTIVDHGGTNNMRIINFSTPTKALTTSTMWPHCWPTATRGMDLVVLNSAQDEPNTVIHELYHALGIYDMYSGDNYPLGEPEPLGSTDMMSTGCYNSGYCTTSAQNLFMLGWLGNVTPYEDGVTSYIENITEPGVYTLQSEFSQTGTIAYRFGTVGEEFFLVEMRTIHDGNKDNRYLVVQRINMEYRDNHHAKNESECMILGMKNQRDNFYSVENDAFGISSCPLYYSDDTLANFSIANIKLMPNNTIQFELFTTTNPAIGDTNEFVDDGKRNFYIFVTHNGTDFLAATSVQIYNSETSNWESVTNIALVYVDNKKHYALLDLNEKYTKVKVTYSSYGFSDSKTVNLSSKFISVQLNKNVIQITGDFLNGVKDGIGGFIGGLFS